MRIIVIIVVMIMIAIMALTIIMVIIVIIDTGTGHGRGHLHPFTAVRIAPSNNPRPAKNECVNERILIVRGCPGSSYTYLVEKSGMTLYTKTLGIVMIL